MYMYHVPTKISKLVHLNIICLCNYFICQTFCIKIFKFIDFLFFLICVWVVLCERCREAWAEADIRPEFCVMVEVSVPADF